MFLTKPNNVELAEFFGEKYETLEEIISAGEKLRKMGSKNVIISLGKNGSVLVTEKGVWIGNVPRTFVSSVGAGDSMVAGTIYGIIKGMDMGGGVQIRNSFSKCHSFY